MYDLSKAGGVPLSVVSLCLHGNVCHRHTENIRSKNGEAIIQCFLSNYGNYSMFSE